MKKLGIYLFTIAAVLSGTAHAGSDLCLYQFPEGYCGRITKIYCTYKSRNSSRTNLTFELPANMDFRHISGHTVGLRLNKESKSRLFNVKTKAHGSRLITELNYQNSFFISDIQLSFVKEIKNNTLLNPIKGTLITDYPPAREMECNFNWGNP